MRYTPPERASLIIPRISKTAKHPPSLTLNGFGARLIPKPSRDIQRYFLLVNNMNLQTFISRIQVKSYRSIAEISDKP
jgi:hypothetical protein